MLAEREYNVNHFIACTKRSYAFPTAKYSIGLTCLQACASDNRTGKVVNELLLIEKS